MAYQPWQNPDPQAIAGLNSVFVYGENMQCAVGINHQLAVGTNLAVCVNPLGAAELLGIPNAADLSGFLGAGAGGNMQFTIGTSASVVLGRSFDIKLGNDQVAIDADKQHVGGWILCGLIGAAVLVWSILYGVLSDENDRANSVIAFQGLMQVLLSVLMVVEMSYVDVEHLTSDNLKRLFGVTEENLHANAAQGLVELAELLAVLAAIVAPIGLATEEGHFQGQTQDRH